MTTLAPSPRRTGWVILVALVGLALLVPSGAALVGMRSATSPGRDTLAGEVSTGGSGCMARGRFLIQPTVPPSGISYQPQPGDDATFLADGVTWRPDPSTYPINIDGDPARLCWVGGQVVGSIPPTMTWEQAHELNQPCLRIVATGWMTVDGLRCEDTGDGLRPREVETGAQDVTMLVHDTYFGQIHDDCLENDGIIGGLVRDSLWESCNTGISERPSDSQGPFSQPGSETLTLDHMLIGLWVTPHAAGPGENALFKWSDSANRLVIRCSMFKVDAVSLNGPDTMAIPGTVDDRACPNHPTTLVWLGGGPYPGQLPAGIHVTDRIEVWDRAVAAWKCAHGMQPTC